MAKIDWKERALEAEQKLAEVTAPKRTGRRPAPPRTPHGHLIAEAVEVLDCSRGRLAELVAKKTGKSFQQSRLAAANRPQDDGGAPLTDEQKAAIEELVANAKKKRGK